MTGHLLRGADFEMAAAADFTLAKNIELGLDRQRHTRGGRMHCAWSVGRRGD